jgi:hypothetical protein
MVLFSYPIHEIVGNSVNLFFIILKLYIFFVTNLRIFTSCIALKRQYNP